MPELPEVETIRKDLHSRLKDFKICKVTVFKQEMLIGGRAKILNTRIIGIRRLGKALIIDFANNYTLAIHLRMTGQLILTSKPKNLLLPNKWTHIIFELQGTEKSLLFYNDIRRFGRLQIVPTKKLFSLPFFASLGPDAISVSPSEFSALLTRSRTSIKEFLIEQKKIAGVGNIYASEALFLAKIHPLKKANKLSPKEAAVLLRSLKRVLKKSISLGGASSVNYVNAFGQKGKYQENFLVYKKENKKCFLCQTEIKRVVISARATFFCPQCQAI